MLVLQHTPTAVRTVPPSVTTVPDAVALFGVISVTSPVVTLVYHSPVDVATRRTEKPLPRRLTDEPARSPVSSNTMFHAWRLPHAVALQ